MLNRLLAKTSLLALALITACSGGSSGGGTGGTFTATNYTGTWNGTWTNTTFASTGAVSATVTENGSTFTIVFDMDGGVFGGSDPAAETLTATFNTTNADLVSITSTVYGTLTASLASDGTLTASGTGIPGAVDRFTLTGTWTTTQITANVTITFDNTTTANGTATLTKV